MRPTLLSSSKFSRTPLINGSSKIPEFLTQWIKPVLTQTMYWLINLWNGAIIMRTQNHTLKRYEKPSLCSKITPSSHMDWIWVRLGSLQILSGEPQWTPNGTNNWFYPDWIHHRFEQWQNLCDRLARALLMRDPQIPLLELQSAWVFRSPFCCSSTIYEHAQSLKTVGCWMKTQ